MNFWTWLGSLFVAAVADDREPQSAPAGIPVSAIGDARPDLPVLPEAAVDLVKRWEGFRAKPYLCPAGVPTIGYGATAYLDGRKVTLQDAPISEPDAAALLRRMLLDFSGRVRALVKVPLTDNEFGALTSLAYNIGTGALKDSTLLRKLNAGDREGAAAEFAKWNKGGGKVLPGLVSRRAEEAALFRAP